MMALFDEGHGCVEAGEEEETSPVPSFKQDKSPLMTVIDMQFLQESWQFD